jgi:hypothetical protein
VTGWLFCVLNFEDSGKAMGQENETKAKDVAELLI